MVPPGDAFAPPSSFLHLIPPSSPAHSERQATPFGVNLGAGAQFALERTSSVNSVFITAMASKVQNAPIALPATFPPLTPESLNLLRSRGRTSFFATYGTHFVFGFRMGAYLSYMFEYQSNERATKAEIAGQISAENGTTSGSASLAYKRALTAKGVNIIATVRTNSYLPPNECGDLVVSQNFDPDKTGDCIKAWILFPPEAAYGAFAVPFEYHPDFSANLPVWDTVPGTTVDDNSNLDRNYASGLLRVRLNSIKNSLDPYQFKEDRFYATVQTTIEVATAAVNDLLDKLRRGVITSFAQWQSLYNLGLSKVNLASIQANFVPAGG